MKKLSITLLVSILIFNVSFAQEKKQKQEKEDKIKTGWTFGAVPAIAYDSDLGFKYGALVNFYNYGDGKNYPKYLQSLYLEMSRTTKGNGINRIFFDSENMFPNKAIRITADLSYLTEKALDFYGFNGYQAAYIKDFSDEDSDDYISRMYYRMDRNIFKFTTDFSGKISNNLKWLAGFAHYNHKMSSVDFDNLNKGKDENDDDFLIDTITLFDKYVNNGFISEEESDGGIINYIKLGTVYDTRDNEANPMQGIWSEAIITTAPSFLGNQENSYTKLSLTHRQYFTILPKKLSFAYRLGYQGTIAGNAPFYMQPYLVSSFSRSSLTEGLGGSKSLRGIVRDRIVGDGIIYSNFEFRWKCIKTVVFNQNLYIALSTFMDAGQIVDEIEIDRLMVPEDENTNDYFDTSKDELHISYGAGVHFALNENFIVAIDYGIAKDKRDGDKGLYIGMNFLF
ncbi:MAG: BamA/TamA family outer membrane protein [Bacteroidota bacterium]|nr:BamA/TamA family outer membrane protein [Bacteroidota bacterium]